MGSVTNGLTVMRRHFERIVMSKQELAQCGLCFQMTMTRNPHPDAGKPEHIVTVGHLWECIPCQRRLIHEWSSRACLAERERDKLRLELESQETNRKDC